MSNVYVIPSMPGRHWPELKLVLACEINYDGKHWQIQRLGEVLPFTCCTQAPRRVRCPAVRDRVHMSDSGLDRLTNMIFFWREQVK